MNGQNCKLLYLLLEAHVAIYRLFRNSGAKGRRFPFFIYSPSKSSPKQTQSKPKTRISPYFALFSSKRRFFPLSTAFDENSPGAYETDFWKKRGRKNGRILRKSQFGTTYSRGRLKRTKGVEQQIFHVSAHKEKEKGRKERKKRRPR